MRPQTLEPGFLLPNSSSVITCIYLGKLLSDCLSFLPGLIKIGMAIFSHRKITEVINIMYSEWGLEQSRILIHVNDMLVPPTQHLAEGRIC